MRKSALILLAFCLLVLSGCGVMARKVSDGDAQAVAKSIRYIKDPESGLCFGIVATAKTGDWANSASITWVPCENVEHLIVNK